MEDKTLSTGQIAARKAWATRRRNAAIKAEEAEAKTAAASNAAHKAWATRRRNAVAKAEEAEAMNPAQKAWATRRRNVEEATAFEGKRADLARIQKDCAKRAEAAKETK